MGRPARINRSTIAEAVLEIGIDRASMKAVADHLGVSVPGLYHHVRNRKELLLLAAERSLTQMRPPADRGQRWYEWLREWARYSRAAFIDEPEVFSQYLKGAISWDVVVEVMDSVVRVLSRQGFSPTEALEAWDAVEDLAVGAAVNAIRVQQRGEPSDTRYAELGRVLEDRRPGELAGARAVADSSIASLEDEFEESLTTLLVGVAVRRGEPWTAVVGSSPRPDPPAEDQTSMGSRL